MIFVFQTYKNTNRVALHEKQKDVLRVATYNVHYIRAGVQTGPWSVSDWDRRKEPMSLAIQKIDADIIGFQEMESFSRDDADNKNLTRDYLLQKNPRYSAGAIGDTQDFPSTQPIFYNTEKFKLLDQGWFFFSDTPDSIYSRTFNGSYPAFASWIQIQNNETDNVLRVVNIHTDFASSENRTKSIELVASRVRPWIQNNETVLVMGDFNARLGSSLHKIIEEEGLVFSPIRSATYHFNKGLNLFGAIDHVAFSKELEIVSEPVVLQEKFAGEWPTDHYPVVVDFKVR